MNKKLYILLVLITLTIIGIFWNSSKPAKISNKYSEAIALRLAPVIIAEYRDAPLYEKDLMITKLNNQLRNIAHAISFGVLSVLALSLLFMVHTVKNKKISLIRGYITALLFCFLFAVVDETHQLFVDGRAFEIGDIIIDLIGASIGAFFVCCTKLVKEGRKGIRNEKT